MNVSEDRYLYSFITDGSAAFVDFPRSHPVLVRDVTQTARAAACSQSCLLVRIKIYNLLGLPDEYSPRRRLQSRLLTLFLRQMTRAAAG